MTRPDAPAVALATTASRAVAAFTVASEEGSHVWVADLASGAPLILQSSTGGAAALAPAVLSTSDGGVTVVWREIASATPGRISWSASDATGEPFSPARPLPGEFGSDPHGGGSPATVMAALGKPRSPGAALGSPLGLLQRSPGSPDGWITLPPPLIGRPLGYSTWGTEPGSAVAAVLNESGELRLARIGGDAHSDVRALHGALPAGPTPVWLGESLGTILAGWSERTFGRRGHAAVRLTRSPDGGRTWSPPYTLMESADGLHPQGSFARDGSTVAAVWRASEGGVQRILLRVSADAGATFESAVAVDDGSPARERSRPRVAVLGPRVFVTWQEGRPDGGQGVLASLSDDGGASIAPIAERLAAPPAGRTLRNPQPWLVAGGGVVWESVALPSRDSVLPMASPARATLHLRRLRR